MSVQEPENVAPLLLASEHARAFKVHARQLPSAMIDASCEPDPTAP